MASVVKTYEQIADHFGVSRDVVRRDWKRKGMPGSVGKWDLDAIEAWRKLTFRVVPKGNPVYGDIPGSPENSPSKPSEEMEKVQHSPHDVDQAKAAKIIADARRAAAEAQLKELAVRKAIENLVHMDDVERVFSKVFTDFRRRLERVKVEMAGSFPASHRETLVQELADRHRMVLGQGAEHLRELVEVRDAKS